MLLAAGELPIAPMVVDLFVALAGPDAASAGFELARQARVAGLRAQLELSNRSLKGQLKHADRIGARYVAIVSAGQPTSLKEMETGEQQQLGADQVIPTILRGSRLG